jgi:hypothetical protein
MRRPWVLFVIALALGAGCDSGEPTAVGPPCVVSEEQMASILDAPETTAIQGDNGYECIYAAHGQPVVSLAVRSPQQFQAERAKFEDQGILVPPLEPVSGFDDQATVDPRYNSLNVTAGDSVVSVQLLGTEPADPGEQVELEKQIARAAVSQL